MDLECVGKELETTLKTASYNVSEEASFHYIFMLKGFYLNMGNNL